MAVMPKCKESVHWRHKDRDVFGDFDHELFYHHALHIGSNVTNALYNSAIARKGSGACLHNISTNALPTTLEMLPCKFPELGTKTSQKLFGWVDGRLNLP